MIKIKESLILSKLLINIMQSCENKFQVGSSLKNKERNDNFDDIFEIIQQKANKQMEDRICYDFVKSFKAYAFTVLDGHGSKQCAQYVHKNLNKKINQSFRQNQKLKLTPNHLVQKCLDQAFSQIEKEWFEIYKENKYNFDFRRSGACYLTALICNKFIHIANAGDCQGIILGKGSPLKTNKRLNAGQKDEKQRLKKQFPFDKDIVVQRSNSQKKVGFVKGQLQPTRAIGDFELKKRDQFWGAKKDFNGPYIEFKPKYSHFRLKKDDQFLVLATDGFWDEMETDKIDEIARVQKQNLGKALYQECLRRIKKRNNMSEKEMECTGIRRVFHDDISIILVDLKKAQERLSDKTDKNS